MIGDGQKHPEDDRGVEYFDKGVLDFYRQRPDLYEIVEQDFGARVSVACGDEKVKGRGKPEYLYVRFGYRRLRGGGDCVGAWHADIGKLGPENKKRWDAFRKVGPHFVNRGKDSRWRNWVGRCLEGDDEIQDQSLDVIRREVGLVRAITAEVFGAPLWKRSWNPQVCRPTADNGEAYSEAHKQMYRLLIDELDKKAIEALAAGIAVKLTNSDQTMNSMKEILKAGGKQHLWDAFGTCAAARVKVHGVGEKRRLAFPATATFEKDLKDLAKSARGIRKYLERMLKVSARNCAVRRGALSRTEGDNARRLRQPERKAVLEALKGKRILSVELRAYDPGMGGAEAEVMLLTFTGGTVLMLETNAAYSGSISEKAWRRARVDSWISPRVIPPRR